MQDNDIIEMKAMYGKMDSFLYVNDFVGADKYIVELIESNSNFQLCSAALMITKPAKKFLKERERLVTFAKEQATKENFEEDNVQFTLNGII